MAASKVYIDNNALGKVCRLYTYETRVNLAFGCF